MSILIPVVDGNANDVVPANGLKVQVVDLTTLDPKGMPVGTVVVDSTAAAWTLTVSTATVDHTTVEAVAGCPGLRWVATSGGGTGGFGSDTIVPLANAGASDVNALEVIASLTNTGVGTEASKWVVKLLSAGAQTTALDIRPGQTLSPDGTHSLPSMSFQNQTNSGLYREPGAANTVSLALNGAESIRFGGSEIWFIPYGDLNFGSIQGTIMFGGDGSVPAGRAYIRCDQGVELGAATAGYRATNATTGFVHIQGCQGPPTGTPSTLKSGRIPFIIDDTTGTGKLWAYIAGTWRGVALA